MSGTVKQTERPITESIATEAGFLVDPVGRITEHAPELYSCAAIAEKLDGFDSIGDAALTQYREQGFLAIENAFDPEEVEDAKLGLARLIMGDAPGFRHIQFEPGAADRLPDMTLEERQDAVRKLMHFTPFDHRLAAISDHPGLMGVAARILGDTPRLFQDMALLKPPSIGREKPWHQDHAYFDFPLGTPIVGVWIALDAATLENGCMHVLAGGHKLGPKPHFQRRDWQICDTEMMGVSCTAVPLKPGGLMIFDALLPHGTPVNRSAQRRRALQYHYAPASAKKTSTDERLAVFGGEGRNVSC